MKININIDNENASVPRATTDDESSSSSHESDKKNKDNKNDKNDKDNKNNKPEQDDKNEQQDEEKQAKKEEQDEIATAKKAMKTTKRAGSIAQGAIKAGMFVKMMNFFQMLMGMMAQGFQALLSTFATMLSILNNIVHAVVGFVAGLGTTVAGFLGVSALAGTATTSVSLVIVLALVIGIFGSVISSSSDGAMRDGELRDCTIHVEKAMAGGVVNEDAHLLSNAKAVYSILHVYGLSDEQIAGVLGNFSTESSIDPSAIEGVYGEKYNAHGEKHLEAMADLDAYVRGPLSDAYQGFMGSGGPINNPGGYTASDGKMYPGLGMGQYTGGGAKTFLNFAESVNQKWYTLEFQIAYTLAKGAPASGTGFWEDYKAQSGDAKAMARYFSQYWEGNTSNAWETRQNSAESWFEKLQDWSVNDSYANSVIDLAEQLGATATDDNVAKQKSVCVKTKNVDNSSMARAAVSYAYETIEEGEGNNGTDVYQRVHDVIWGAGDIYQSCDRGVATAIQWSGADITYPRGNTDFQLIYMMASPKWTHVGKASELTMDDLLPGDVFCLNGHTFMYVGNETVKERYPESNGDSVSASFNERSPGVGIDATDIIERMHGQDWLDRGEYQVFRCTKPDNSSKWMSAGSGI